MKKNIYMCITESLCCIAEINIVNQLYFNKIYQKKIRFFENSEGMKSAHLGRIPWKRRRWKWALKDERTW